MVAGVDGVPGKRVRSRVEGDIIPVNGRAITPHQITAEIIAGDYQTKPWPVTLTAVQLTVDGVCGVNGPSARVLIPSMLPGAEVVTTLPRCTEAYSVQETVPKIKAAL